MAKARALWTFRWLTTMTAKHFFFYFLWADLSSCSRLVLFLSYLVFTNFYSKYPEDFPGGRVVDFVSSAGDVGSIPGQELKISDTQRPKNQNVKQKQYCNKFNKDFQNNPH